jgi:hypothetical protein
MNSTCYSWLYTAHPGDLAGRGQSYSTEFGLPPPAQITWSRISEQAETLRTTLRSKRCGKQQALAKGLSAHLRLPRIRTGSRATTRLRHFSRRLERRCTHVATLSQDELLHRGGYTVAPMAGTPRTRSPAGDAAFASASASASATERSPLLADAQQRKARSMPVLGAPATNNDADEATRTISGTTTPHGTPQSRQEVAIASLPERLSRAALIAQKREQPEDDKTQWQILSVKARYYIPVRPSPSVLPPIENSYRLGPPWLCRSCNGCPSTRSKSLPATSSPPSP